MKEVFDKEFPKAELKNQLADSLSLLFSTKPTSFNGVLVSDNTFGDILSDKSGGLTGSPELLPSVSLAGPLGPGTAGGTLRRDSISGVVGLYEPRSQGMAQRRKLAVKVS